MTDAKQPTAAEKKEAIAVARKASRGDLICLDCKAERKIEPIQFKFNPKTNSWELRAWKLLGDWRSRWCPKCQAQRDKAEKERLKKLQEEADAQEKKMRAALVERHAKIQRDAAKRAKELEAEEKKKRGR